MQEKPKLYPPYTIKLYSCPKCGEFEVIHSGKKINKACCWCNAPVKYIKTVVTRNRTTGKIKKIA